MSKSIYPLQNIFTTTCNCILLQDSPVVDIPEVDIPAVGNPVVGILVVGILVLDLQPEENLEYRLVEERLGKD